MKSVDEDLNFVAVKIRIRLKSFDKLFFTEPKQKMYQFFVVSTGENVLNTDAA